MHTILVPVDGSGHALKALNVACDLAEKYDARVAVLHVLAEGKSAEELLALDVGQAFGPQLRAALEDARADAPGPASHDLVRTVGREILDQAESKVVRRGILLETLEMQTGDPAENILIAHKRTGASTIVMGCRGKKSTDGSAFGSVSNTVFARADCTCLSVK